VRGEIVYGGKTPSAQKYAAAQRAFLSHAAILSRLNFYVNQLS
jgi:hypothetical protein